MAQLSYDEIRLLRELKNSERRISGNKLDVGLERLVKEGYAITFHPNAAETIYSITTKGWAALRCMRPRGTIRATRPCCPVVSPKQQRGIEHGIRVGRAFVASCSSSPGP
jgi:DNA-binding PadR family transcriptional regulator